MARSSRSNHAGRHSYVSEAGAEPADEIGEAWQYAGAIFVTGFCLNLAVFLLLFVLFGRALKPLTALASGLEDLKEQNYRVRLVRPSLPELAVIADHFNQAAGALEGAHDANRALNRKLVIAQDDERRRTALELHDEVGPVLFALDVNTGSMVDLSGRLEPEGLAVSRDGNTVVDVSESTSMAHFIDAPARTVVANGREHALRRQRPHQRSLDHRRAESEGEPLGPGRTIALGPGHQALMIAGNGTTS